MICYCMSDIHGYLYAFNEALNLVINQLDKNDTKLILLGDYIHGGEENYEVLDKIMELQYKYGSDKVIALLGNHEEAVCEGRDSINGYNFENNDTSDMDDKYINWMLNLPRYYVEGKTIFVHAGIDEETEEMWEYGTSDYIFTEKYPAEIGKFFEDYKIVAGHIGTSIISEDSHFHNIFYDGQSHYYIDSTVQDSGFINVLKVDIEKQEYYEVTENGEFPIMEYNKQ